eukprot:8345837-Pyramimonas_sp.AAC.1
MSLAARLTGPVVSSTRSATSEACSRRGSSRRRTRGLSCRLPRRPWASTRRTARRITGLGGAARLQ